MVMYIPIGSAITFPSPTGVLYISMLGALVCYISSGCFRPLLGFFIFQFISQKQGKSFGKFPSPTGVLYISIINGTQLVDVDEPVSVPYWGSLYFNYEKYVFHSYKSSFRPLLGFFIFQLQVIYSKERLN